MEVFEYEIIYNKGDDMSGLTNPDEIFFWKGTHEKNMLHGIL